MSELLTINELAEYLRVPVDTLRKWRVQGKGPRGARVGKHVRYRRAEVERWLTQQEAARGA